MSRNEEIPPKLPAKRSPQYSRHMKRIFDIISNALWEGSSGGSQQFTSDRRIAGSETQGRDISEHSDEYTSVWRQVPRAMDTAPEERCLILGLPSAPESIVISATLSENGYDVDICNDVDAVLASLTSASEKALWSMFIVDLDFFREHVDIEDCVDELVQMRSERCNLPLILVSSNFARDDYGEDRLPIADASLRAPVLGTRILYAARIAKANNQVWKARCASGTSE